MTNSVKKCEVLKEDIQKRAIMDKTKATATKELKPLPQAMMMPEDLLMNLEDEADGEERVLHYLLDDYKGDEERREMLFSEEGIEASLKGLSALKEVIERHEQIVKSRKQQP